eukprot:GHVR01193020.1.p1 GENE.GHVR01193020.1~~GHVR01193020.1.p1  ORF type:complete len:401 (-),score=108.46 GHVR01193020.1:356-1558(-)
MEVSVETDTHTDTHTHTDLDAVASALHIPIINRRIYRASTFSQDRMSKYREEFESNEIDLFASCLYRSLTTRAAKIGASTAASSPLRHEIETRLQGLQGLEGLEGTAGEDFFTENDEWWDVEETRRYGPGKIDVVGHSYGTALTSCYFKLFPEAVNSVCILDPVCFAVQITKLAQLVELYPWQITLIDMDRPTPPTGLSFYDYFLFWCRTIYRAAKDQFLLFVYWCALFTDSGTNWTTTRQMHPSEFLDCGGLFGLQDRLMVVFAREDLMVAALPCYKYVTDVTERMKEKSLKSPVVLMVEGSHCCYFKPHVLPTLSTHLKNASVMRDRHVCERERRHTKDQTAKACQDAYINTQINNNINNNIHCNINNNINSHIHTHINTQKHCQKHTQIYSNIQVHP